MSNYNPQPDIWIDGGMIRSTPVYVDGSPRVDHSTPTLIESFAIEWGRDNPWQQPDAATLKFVMFDPTGDWLQRIRNRNAIGKPVAILTRINGADYTVFRGWTTDVDAEQDRGHTPDGWVDGWRVAVTVADPTAALGNIRIGAEQWPVETMLARAVKIRNRAAPAGIRQFYFDPNSNYPNGTTRAIELKDTDLAAVVRDFYTSFADQYAYHAHRNVVKRIPRKRLAITAGLRLVDVPGKLVAPGLGDWQDPSGSEDPIDKQAHPSATIDGSDVGAVLALGTDQLVDITRIECTWKNGPGGWADVTTVKQKPNSPDPQRTLAFQSWFGDGLQIDPIVSKTYEKATLETALPNHPRITFDTRYTGGFQNWHQAECLLTPSEDVRTVFVTGSPFAAAFDQLPVYSPSGGRIEYEAGHWRIAVDLTACSSSDPAPAPAWSAVNKSIDWVQNGGRWAFTPGTSWADLKWSNLTDVYPVD